MFCLSNNHNEEKEAMRDVYCNALMQEAEKNPKIVAVDADVMHSLGTLEFHRKFPERSINCGIQEANAVGVSAGLSVTGFIPFFHTFSTFATRRVYDQVFLSCAYSGLNVKLIGGDAGVTTAVNGGTHMPFEDMGIMRNIPGMTVIEPSDSTMLKSLVPQMADHYGNFYMRMCRRNMIKIYEDSSVFEIGKATVLKDGADVTVIANGIMVYEALKAYEMLREKNIHARVVDMFTMKPVDEACIVESAEKTGAVVTAENHNIINGLGSAVSEVLSEQCPVPLERVGVRDEFGEVGEQQFLMNRFRITAAEICEKAMKAIERKGLKS
ncbi:MAG: transketolase family protein [Eubacteriales bacterium]|nr:transketolase family protein [Eubacteriales bacterium]